MRAFGQVSRRLERQGCAQPIPGVRLAATKRNAPSSLAWKRRLSNMKAQSICRTSNQEAFQQLDKRLLLTRRNDADFEVN